MAKTRTITEYDSEDIEKLHSMSDKEVSDVLMFIKRGHLPQSYVLHGEEGRVYSEAEYEAAKLHIAINKAIMLLES